MTAHRINGVLVHTEYDAKPIPNRCGDHYAYLDNYEPGMPIGTGATEEEAVEDLREKLECQ